MPSQRYREQMQHIPSTMKTIAILCAVYAALYVAGCAYQGDVLIYSPGGDVDKATELDSNVSLK